MVTARASALLALLGAGAVLGASGTVVRADESVNASVEPPEPEPEPAHRWGGAVLETTGAMLIGTGWYWANADLNGEDWDLDWSWRSWRDKLFTADDLVLDTNDFYTNAVRHPFGGTFLYQLGRANGFDALGANLLAFTGTVFWEYVVEYRERISINDIIVTGWSGIAIGEPLFQLGAYARAQGDGWLARGLGALLSPVDAVHDAAGVGVWPRAGRAWHRFRLLSQMDGEVAAGSLGRGSLRLGLDLELVRHRSFARTGTGSDATRPGAWSRLFVLAGTGQGGPGSLARTELRSQTTLGGWYQRDLFAAADGLHGWDLFLGAGAGFVYDTREVDDAWDKLCVTQLLGPRLELGLYHGRTRLGWELAAYGDFAMVEAYVFGLVPPMPPASGTPTSVLRARGYYYAGGLSAASRAYLEAPPWEAELEVAGYHFWSIDGLDRRELGDGMEDPHGVQDQRLYASGRLGLRGRGGALGVAAVADAVLRRGTWHDEERAGHTLTLGLEMTYRF